MLRFTRRGPWRNLKHRTAFPGSPSTGLQSHIARSASSLSINSVSSESLNRRFLKSAGVTALAGLPCVPYCCHQKSNMLPVSKTGVLPATSTAPRNSLGRSTLLRPQESSCCATRRLRPRCGKVEPSRSHLTYPRIIGLHDQRFCSERNLDQP